MDDQLAKKSLTQKEDDMVVCQVCSDYLKKGEGFACPRCKRSPICRRHRVEGKKECAGCLVEALMYQRAITVRHEAALRSFTQFLQFLVIVSAIYYGAIRYGVFDIMEIMKKNPVADNIIVFGSVFFISMVISYIILLIQRKTIRDLDVGIKKIEIRR